MVTASIKFLVRTSNTPVYYASVGGEEAELNLDGQFETVDIDILDGRENRLNHSLDKEGFLLVDHVSAVSDFFDDSQLTDAYEDEVKALIARVTGARRVVVFDHTRRADSKAMRAARKIREPSAIVHNDYTDTSAAKRVRDILGEEAEELLSRRFAIINVWRAISHPAETSQLALCDASTLNEGDAIAVERRAEDRIGELTMGLFNPDNRWVHFPSMQLDEALLLKTHDSATDGRARFSLHTAFDNPAPPEGAKPRESLETRTFAFF